MLENGQKNYQDIVDYYYYCITLQCSSYGLIVKSKCALTSDTKTTELSWTTIVVQNRDWPEIYENSLIERTIKDMIEHIEKRT